MKVPFLTIYNLPRFVKSLIRYLSKGLGVNCNVKQTNCVPKKYALRYVGENKIRGVNLVANTSLSRY